MRSESALEVPILDAATLKGELATVDLEAVARAYKPSLHEAPLVFGQPRHDKPAAGWVTALKVRSKRLIATLFQLSPQARDAFAKGHIKRIEARLFRPDAANSPTPGVHQLASVVVPDIEDNSPVPGTLSFADPEPVKVEKKTPRAKAPWGTKLSNAAVADRAMVWKSRFANHDISLTAGECATFVQGSIGKDGLNEMPSRHVALLARLVEAEGRKQGRRLSSSEALSQVNAAISRFQEEPSETGEVSFVDAVATWIFCQMVAKPDRSGGTTWAGGFSSAEVVERAVAWQKKIVDCGFAISAAQAVELVQGAAKADGTVVLETRHLGLLVAVAQSEMRRQRRELPHSEVLGLVNEAVSAIGGEPALSTALPFVDALAVWLFCRPLAGADSASDEDSD